MKKTLSIILTISSIAYPFIWYYSHQQGWFNHIVIIMIILWLLRATLQTDRLQQIIALIIASFFGIIGWQQQPHNMYWYPVWVNLLMLTLFSSSLLTKQSLIERIARLSEPNLPQAAIAYTRKVTIIWCLFFIINGSIATALILTTQYNWWTIYTGIIAYILMASLMGIEFLYRKRHIKQTHSPK